MAVDKSLSQYQHLLEGTTLGALRKAGIVDAPIQRNVISDPIKKNNSADSESWRHKTR